MWVSFFVNAWTMNRHVRWMHDWLLGVAHRVLLQKKSLTFGSCSLPPSCLPLNLTQSTRALLISSVRQFGCLCSIVFAGLIFWVLAFCPIPHKGQFYTSHPSLDELAVCFFFLRLKFGAEHQILNFWCKASKFLSPLSRKPFTNFDLPQVFFDLVRQVNKTAPSRRQTTKKKRKCCPRKTLSCPSCCRICW